MKTVHGNCACFPFSTGTLHELDGTGVPGYQGTRVPGLSTATCEAGKYASEREHRVILRVILLFSRVVTIKQRNVSRLASQYRVVFGTR